MRRARRTAAACCRAAAPRTRTPRPPARARRRSRPIERVGQQLADDELPARRAASRSAARACRARARARCAIDDRFVVMTSSSSARTPGIMKSRLSSCGLNQTRMRASIGGGGRLASPRCRAASSRAYAADQALRVAERDVRRVRVGAVGHDLHRRRPSGADASRRSPAGIDERQPRPPAARGTGRSPSTLVTVSTIVKYGDAVEPR